VEALQQKGWSIWWDSDIPPGKTWEQVIEAALEEARCVIVVWSKTSVEAHWVLTEAHEGMRRGILVPALLDAVTIPLAFRRIQAANLVDWSGGLPNAGFEKLAKAVSGVLGVDAGKPAAPVEQANVAGSHEVPPVEHEPQPVAVSPKDPLPRPARSIFQNRLFGLAAALALIGIGIYAVTRNPPVSKLAAPGQDADVPPSAPQAPLVQVPGQTRKNKIDSLDYVWVPSGNFMMGCSPKSDNLCRDDADPPHDVKISKGFWIGKTEVTEAAYGRFPHGRRPEHPDLPVVNVKWADAKAYCDWASLQLPTEAQWEYAARANANSPSDLSKVAWYSGNSEGKLHPVCQKAANAWGLCDMLGNAWEWVTDFYDSKYYGTSVDTDPSGPNSSNPPGLHVMRGGTFELDASRVRVSDRDDYAENVETAKVGFRCAGSLP